MEKKSSDFDTNNRRRLDLIDKLFDVGLTEEEEEELNILRNKVISELRKTLPSKE